MVRRLSVTACVALVAFLGGCAGTSVQTYSKPPSGERQYGKVKKVAVMRFDSVVEGAQAARIAGDLFFQELLARGTFEQVEEPRYVAELMKSLKLRNTENLDREVVRKIGEELRAQALVLGEVLLYGQEQNSEIVEFALQVNLIDVESGDILWSGRTVGHSSTTLGEMLGINQGPSVNTVARRAVAQLVARLDREYRKARKEEVERMLETAQAQQAPAEAPAAAEGQSEAGAEKAAEEILLQVKPK
ncbi:MAG: hypothetical protein Kow0092_07640 [Deferrisomatales bacterium]